MNERVTLSKKEIKRHHVLQLVEEGRITGIEASKHLGLSVRQVRHLLAKYRQEGIAGLVHGNCGRTGNNRLDESVWVKIQELAE